MRIQLGNVETLNIQTGDLLKTDKGYRQVVGGNVSYGEVNWLMINPETGEIKSRIRKSLPELLQGYKILEVHKANSLTITVDDCEPEPEAQRETTVDEETNYEE
jgi:hypothetical protein